MRVDNFSARDRKRVEEPWPWVEQDLREIVKPQSQIDPSFKTERLYTYWFYANIKPVSIKKSCIGK